MRIKNYLLYIAVLIILNSCQTLKDGLTGNKKSKSAEEFLIDKKNPLVIPPDLNSLPEPTTSTQNTNKDKEFDINEIIEVSDIPKDKELKSKDNPIEQSIIKIIKQK